MRKKDGQIHKPSNTRGSINPQHGNFKDLYASKHHNHIVGNWRWNKANANKATKDQNWETINPIITDFSSEILEAKRKWNTIFKVLKELVTFRQ